MILSSFLNNLYIVLIKKKQHSITIQKICIFLKFHSMKISLKIDFFIFNFLTNMLISFNKITHDIFFSNNSYAVTEARYFTTKIRDMLEETYIYISRKILILYVSRYISRKYIICIYKQKNFNCNFGGFYENNVSEKSDCHKI